jgi:CDP-glucose 4,6-dehydratase
MEEVELSMHIHPEFWQGRKVLMTGHTGFKGSWLSLWLQSMGAELCGIALMPPTMPALFDVAQVAKGMDNRDETFAYVSDL